MTLESLEDRNLLAAIPTDAVSTLVGPIFQASSGTDHAGPSTDVGHGLERFSSRNELEQFLIDSAVRNYQWWFHGDHHYFWPATANVDAAGLGQAPGFSQTNNQVQGVDEGDIVKTDGKYLYVLAGGKLSIIKALPADEMASVSQTQIEGIAVAMYLDGNRLTVISSLYPLFWFGGGIRGSVGIASTAMADSMIAFPIWGGWWHPRLKVTVFDVSDRAAPEAVHESYLDGTYITSRDIDGKVYVVVQNNTSGYFPWPGFDETEDQYRDRISSTVEEWGFPHLYTRGTDGALIQAGLLVDPTNIYKPLLPDQWNLVSVLAFDVEGKESEPVDAVGVLTSYSSTVFASLDHMDLFVPQWTDAGASTFIYRFKMDARDVTLTSTGEVPGNVWNQFSVDDTGAYVRVATSQGWGANAQNGVYVLAEQGSSLSVIGKLESISPGEQLESARFLGDRAFLVTFKQMDPLLVLDLSDPTNPKLVGELKVPGFSTYLQPIDANHLVGVGYDTNSDGWARGLEISLFDISDPANPVVVDHYSISMGDRALWTWSPAQYDSHAFGYYPASRTLAIPVNGYMADDTSDQPNWAYQSNLWVFHVDPDKGFHLLGKVSQDTTVERSLQIGNFLYSVADGSVKVQKLKDPDTTIAEVALPGWDQYGRWWPYLVLTPAGGKVTVSDSGHTLNKPPSTGAVKSPKTETTPAKQTASDPVDSTAGISDAPGNGTGTVGGGSGSNGTSQPTDASPVAGNSDVTGQTAGNTGKTSFAGQESPRGGQSYPTGATAAGESAPETPMSDMSVPDTETSSMDEARNVTPSSLDLAHHDVLDDAPVLLLHDGQVERILAEALAGEPVNRDAALVLALTGLLIASPRPQTARRPRCSERRG